MSNLPQYELLSAYLDGELSAAERAEAERLLAADPAARQLLDELRAVSQTLQSLPQERLGEDLSRQVLHIAQQRLAAQTTLSEDIKNAPTPSTRSLFGRIINRRGLAWAGLAVAVAAVIAVVERRQGFPVGDAAKQIARAKVEMAAAERPARTDSVPVPAAEPRSSSTLSAVSDKGLDMPIEAATPTNKPAEGLVLRRKSDSEAEMSAKAAASGPPAAAPHDEHRYATRDKAGSPVAVAKKSEDADQIEPGLLVVRCEITPEAARNQTFNQLLTQNNIILEDETKEKATDKVEPTEVVYVEAAPEQIEATLAAIVQRADEFHSISVTPAPGEESQRSLEQYNRRGPDQSQVTAGRIHNLQESNVAENIGRAQRVQLPTDQKRFFDEELPRLQSAVDSFRFGAPRQQIVGQPPGRQATQLDKTFSIMPQQQRAVFVLEVLGSRAAEVKKAPAEQ